jgi:hypothetical protein
MSVSFCLRHGNSILMDRLVGDGKPIGIFLY